MKQNWLQIVSLTDTNIARGRIGLQFLLFYFIYFYLFIDIFLYGYMILFLGILKKKHPKTPKPRRFVIYTKAQTICLLFDLSTKNVFYI